MRSKILRQLEIHNRKKYEIPTRDQTFQPIREQNDEIGRTALIDASIDVDQDCTDKKKLD